MPVGLTHFFVTVIGDGSVSPFQTSHLLHGNIKASESFSMDEIVFRFLYIGRVFYVLEYFIIFII
jgi:hypothetical protein